MTKLVVRNLPDAVDVRRVQDLFEGCGAVRSIRLTWQHSGHRFNQVGVVELDDCDARAAVAALDGRLLEGALLSVQELDGTAAAQLNGEAFSGSPPRGRAPGAGRAQYQVVGVHKSDGPGGAAGDDWYRYELAGGNSRITGFRRGTLATVTEYADAYGTHLNERKRTGSYAPRTGAPQRRK